MLCMVEFAPRPDSRGRTSSSQPLNPGTARSLARRILAARARSILIDGPSGSGKSTFASRLLRELHIIRAPQAELVQMDDLYPGWAGLDLAVASVARDLVRPHSLGLPALWRPWNWASGTTAGVRQARAPLLLLEGCGAAGAASRAHADLTLWIEADSQARKKRALARDGELMRLHWNEWERHFWRYCERERPREGADLVLDSTAHQAYPQPSSCKRWSSIP